MTFGGFVFLVVVVIAGLFMWGFVSAQKEREKIDAMSPEVRSNYVFGPINVNLICPHCQTKSLVHVKKVSRAATSTGQVGGILKADTTSTITTVVTQHHCDQCSSTWDI
jgi:hypothetical protein